MRNRLLPGAGVILTSASKGLKKNRKIARIVGIPY
jgi:hypothetical protein